ncbi:RICIN domain-containing protein [Amycolatopsis sp. NPDC059021]|uniref:RICIN domain-containing protein n=1 Tax=Amycolatopsis sp. NPDC059021 TaxID=3346704 RepID=UPI00366C6B17
MVPDGWPDPRTAADVPGFLAGMRQVRALTGLSFRALERRAAKAGDALPSSTISAALSRDKLPRADLVAAFVRACGGDDQTVEDWLAARAALVVEAIEPIEGAEPESAEAGPRGRRGRQFVIAAAVVVVVAVAAVVLLFGRDKPGSAAPAAPSPPPGESAHRQPIRLAYTGLCLGEGPEKFKPGDRTVLGQHPCAAAKPPISLEPAASGSYRLVLLNPDLGPGCVTVDYGGAHAEVLLAGAGCEGDRPDQRFTFEKVTSPLTGYRIHSVAGAQWCVGVYGGSTEAGVQLVQAPCDGGAHQIFVVDGL